MRPTLCSKCKKNVAVIFVTKIEDGNTVSDYDSEEAKRLMSVRTSLAAV